MTQGKYGFQKIWCVIILGLSMLSPAYAQSPETVSDQQTPNTPTIQQFIIDHSDRMTVPVRINGGEPVPFIVDTGSERTVVANDLARYLALEAGPVLRLATITGVVSVNSFVIDNLKTAVIDIDGIEAPGLDRGDMGAYGLLGIDSLEDRKVLLDFKGQKMEVLPSPVRKNRSSLENGMIVVRATRRAGRMILSSAKTSGFPVDIIIDTGAQSSMGNTALRDKLRRRDLRFDFTPVKMRSVTGVSLIGDYSQIREIEIGGLSIQNLPISFADNYAFEALKLNNRPAILLGMDALQLFDRVVVDFANRRVAFDLPASTASSNTLSRLGY